MRAFLPLMFGAIALLVPTGARVLRTPCTPVPHHLHSESTAPVSSLHDSKVTLSTKAPGPHRQMSSTLTPVSNVPSIQPVNFLQQAANGNLNEFCIDFTFDNPDWHWTLQPPWGYGTGSFGSLRNGRICVPRADSGGGALFIGAHPNPAANNTKLECFLPTTGTANCDMSLVDGYSLPVTCTMGNTKMGGNIDLWDTEETCENKNNAHLGICTNTRETGSEANVPRFFQPAIRNGHNYCIWTRCTQNPFFPVDAPVNCHVGATKLSPGRS